MDRYIYHTGTIKVNEGQVDSVLTIQKWINSDPYPGYELMQLDYTTKGHQTVWKLKESITRLDVQKLLEKYEKAKIDIINPDNFDDWNDIGFDEPPDDFESINEYLEADPEGELGYERTLQLNEIDNFINDLKELLGEKDE